MANSKSLTGKIVTAASIILPFGVILFGGYLWLQYRKLMNYRYKVANFKILSFSKGKISMAFDLLIKNMSDIGVRIMGYDIEFFFMGKPIAKAINNDVTQFLPNNISTIPVNLTFDPLKKYPALEILQMLEYFTTDKSKLYFEFKGIVKIKKVGYTFPIKIDTKMTLQELLTGESAYGF